MAQRAKIFLLGLGCHKGGSTWLHRHLASLPECNFGVTKEYHTFDTRYLDLFRHFHEDDLRRLPRLFERRRKRWFWQRGRYDRLIEKLAHKVVFHNDPALYAAYFDGLWSRDATASVVGDITPGYAALRAEHFKEIKRLLEAKGFTVKVVFMMRDPVERCYSAVCGPLKEKVRRGHEIDTVARLEEEFATPDFECRTRYDITVANVESVFAAENILLGLYEELFGAAGIHNVHRFLGIDRPRQVAAERVNASLGKSEVPQPLAARIAAYYQPTYAFAASRFGEERIRSLWPHYPPQSGRVGEPSFLAQSQPPAQSKRGLASVVMA